MEIKNNIITLFLYSISAFIFGYFTILLYKIGDNSLIGLNDKLAINTGLSFGLIVFVIMMYIFISERKGSPPQPTNLQKAKRYSVPSHNPAINPVNHYLRRYIKVNGKKVAFNFDVSALGLQDASYSDTQQNVNLVYFTSVDQYGNYSTIPDNVLWKLLKYAEKNRRYGKGLSERGLTSQYVYVLGNPDYYWPIINLLFLVEKKTKEWLPPNGIIIIYTTKNKWNILMPDASTVFRLCILYNVGDTPPANELKRLVNSKSLPRSQNSTK